jgi:hypothetical protein
MLRAEVSAPLRLYSISCCISISSKSCNRSFDFQTEVIDSSLRAPIASALDVPVVHCFVFWFETKV